MRGDIITRYSATNRDTGYVVGSLIVGPNIKEIERHLAHWFPPSQYIVEIAPKRKQAA